MFEVTGDAVDIQRYFNTQIKTEPIRGYNKRMQCKDEIYVNKKIVLGGVFSHVLLISYDIMISLFGDS